MSVLGVLVFLFNFLQGLVLIRAHGLGFREGVVWGLGLLVFRWVWAGSQQDCGMQGTWLWGGSPFCNPKSAGLSPQFCEAGPQACLFRPACAKMFKISFPS